MPRSARPRSESMALARISPDQTIAGPVSDQIPGFDRPTHVRRPGLIEMLDRELDAARVQLRGAPRDRSLLAKKEDLLLALDHAETKARQLSITAADLEKKIQTLKQKQRDLVPDRHLRQLFRRSTVSERMEEVWAPQRGLSNRWYPLRQDQLAAERGLGRVRSSLDHLQGCLVPVAAPSARPALPRSVTWSGSDSEAPPPRSYDDDTPGVFGRLLPGLATLFGTPTEPMAREPRRPLSSGLLRDLSSSSPSSAESTTAPRSILKSRLSPEARQRAIAGLPAFE